MQQLSWKCVNILWLDAENEDILANVNGWEITEDYERYIEVHIPAKEKFEAAAGDMLLNAEAATINLTEKILPSKLVFKEEDELRSNEVTSLGQDDQNQIDDFTSVCCDLCTEYGITKEADILIEEANEVKKKPINWQFSLMN